MKQSKTIQDLNSGFGFSRAAKDVDHERCVVFLKTGCVIDGKISLSQRKIMKTVIALEKKTRTNM